MELERLERLKDSVADGTYFVASEKLATKLVDNMLKLGYPDLGLPSV
jgi:anti-sigma28 factor (negative regulator of flagellin synthesis)